MEFLHISREIVFFLEGEDKMRFPKKSIKSPFVPSEEQLQKKIWGIELPYYFDRNQDSSIEQIRKSFGAMDGIIRRVPKSFEIHTIGDMTIFKYGTTEIVPSMLGLTDKVGVTGYWDKSNIIICCLNNYEKLINSIKEKFKTGQGKFCIRLDDWGPNLRIMSLV